MRSIESYHQNSLIPYISRGNHPTPHALLPTPLRPCVRSCSHPTCNFHLSGWRLPTPPPTPPVQRLDMVLAYTSRDRVGQFETAISLWERGAQAVVHREELMGQLVRLRNLFKPYL